MAGDLLRFTFDTDGPEWARTVFIDEAAGKVFVSAAMGGNEERAWLFSTYDAVECVRDKGHRYLPAEWMRAHLKDWDDVFANLLRALRRNGHAVF